MKSLRLNIAREYVMLAVIFVLYFVLQFPTLSNPAFELFDDWRQTDTYSIAVNFEQYDMNIFKPQFNYDGTENIYVQLELQIMPYLSALVFKLTGTVTPFVPRLISLIFYLGSAFFIYKILKNFTAVTSSLMGVIIYLALPISMVYSRAIMPEACAMFFYCGAVYYALLWYINRSKKGIWLSAIFMAFAILEKIPVAFAGFLIIALFVWKHAWRCVLTKEFWGYGFISLGIPFAYFVGLGTYSSSNYVRGIAQKHIFTNRFLSFFSTEAFQFFKTKLPELFGITVLVFALLGLFCCLSKGRKSIIVWAASFLLELITVVAIIKFGYYLVFIAPIISVLCAVFIDDLRFIGKSVSFVCFFIILSFTLYHSVPYWKTVVREAEGIFEIATLINEVSAPDEPIAVSSISPAILNTANRHGYRANIKYHNHIPQGAEEEVNYYICQGVSYFVAPYGQVYDDPTGEYLMYLNDTFVIAGQNEYCTIYNLKEKKK